MIRTNRVAIVATAADRQRAEAIQKAEGRARRQRLPQFMRDGLGACNRIENADDFTTTSKRPTGYAARARAAEKCRVCPFAAECLPWATGAEQTGVFGGEWLIRGAIQGKEKVRAAR